MIEHVGFCLSVCPPVYDILAAKEDHIKKEQRDSVFEVAPMKKKRDGCSQRDSNSFKIVDQRDKRILKSTVLDFDHPAAKQTDGERDGPFGYLKCDSFQVDLPLAPSISCHIKCDKI